MRDSYQIHIDPLCGNIKQAKHHSTHQPFFLLNIPAVSWGLIGILPHQYEMFSFILDPILGTETNKNPSKKQLTESLGTGI